MFNRFSTTVPQPSGLNSSTSNSFFGNPAAASQSNQPAASPFGSFGQTALPPSTSAPSPPYSITNETENGIAVKLLSIACMPAYRHLSHEEIRVDDYAKGRKGPSSFPGAKPGAFSSPFSANTSTTSGFPYSSTPAATATNSSGFGSSAFGSNVFGSNSGSNLSSSAFGTTPAAASANTGTSAFGGSGFSSGTGFGTPSNTSSGFGSNTSSGFGTSSNTSGFGTGSTGNALGSNAFGTSSGFGTAGITSPFGSTAAPAPASGSFGGFGSSAFGAKPTGGFGGFGSTAAPAPSAGIFGSTPSTSTTTTGLFGQQPPQSQFGSSFGTQQSAANSLFGAKPSGSTSLFGSTPQPFGSSGAFASSQPAAAAPAFGSFGAQPAATQPSTTQPFGSSTTGFGGFSQPQAQPTQPQFGMFGSVTAPTSAQPTQSGSSSLFGGSSFGQQHQAQQQQPQTQSTGLFGAPSSLSTSTPSSTGLFGSQQPQAQPFRPATSQFNLPGGGLNTSSATAPSPMFGNGATGMSSNSLFNRPATTSAFGSTMPTSQGSSFQFQPQPQQQPQPQFPNVAPSTGSLSLAPPLPAIFSNVPSANSSSSQPQPQQQQPPKSPVKFTPRTSFRIKPRESYNLTAPVPLNFNHPSVTAAAALNSSSSVLVPRKLAGSVPNIKKLVIPDFSDAAAAVAGSIPSTPSTSTNNSIALYDTTTPSAANGNILTDSMAFGHQYTFPPIKMLKAMAPADRREIKNFVIGQKGAGEIRFLVPVDLSQIDPETIFGHLVEFCEEEAVLYPDPSIPKPPPGQGLNLPAQVRLDRIWTLSRGSRDPIVDPQNEKVVHFIQKLEETEGTNFISYNPATGTWTFTVDHF